MIDNLKMVRRRLTLQQSLSAVKLFYQLLNINENKVTWHFWTITQADLTTLCANYNLQELQDSPPPYRRSLKLLETPMVTLQSYLSSGNLHTPTDTWVVDVAGVTKGRRETS